TMNTPLIDVELNGVIEITQEPVPAVNAQTLKGRIENAQLSFLGPAFAQGTPTTIFVHLDATVTLTGGSAIEILLHYPQDQFKLSASWDKQPMEVHAAITITTQEFTVAVATLKENADVLAVNNGSHIQALEALHIVAASLGDVMFEAAKA